MKILMVHNRYLIRGGEEESTSAEIALLRQHGHEVDFLEADNASLTNQSLLRTGVETIWSSRAYRSVRERLRGGGHDLVHIQNFFPQFSPAIHFAAKAEGKAVVQALRNYRLMCLNVVFYRDQHVCEDCLGRFVPWPGIVHRCYRDSVAGSAAVASMLVSHRLLRTWRSKVDVFVALTQFARRKFEQGGLPPEQIMIKPNFVLPDPLPGNHGENFALFVGRLSAEKGIDTLISAWECLDHIPLKIVGEGPLSPQVREFSLSRAAVEQLGRLEQREVISLMKRARFLVFPSECYEGFPRVIVEAFACGLPVIAAEVGSTAEIVSDRSTGLHFKPGDPADLASKVAWAWDHPAEMAALGMNGRKEYELRYTPERNYSILMDIYQTAIARSRSPRNELSAR
jgi:glycosyltransferase involved in cell wall biosynthesis